MPHTLAALRRGDTSECRATVMARETACLSKEDRQAVDAVVGPPLGQLGDRETDHQARAEAYRRDPGALVRRLAVGAAVPVTVRDRTRRTPWCDAPIRHADHVHESPRELWRLRTHGRVESCQHRGSIRTSCVSARFGW